MKLSIISLAVSLVFASQATAMPAAQYTPAPPVTFHCKGPHNLTCPTGYRCCGPLVLNVGGTCFLGETGICPL